MKRAILTENGVSMTAIQKDREHSAATSYHGSVLFSLGLFDGVVCHSVVWWDWWDNQNRMKLAQHFSELFELAVSSTGVTVLSPP